MLGMMWKVAFCAEQARHRVGRVDEAFERAFHPPFGHALARMLAGIEPELQRAVAEPQPVDRLAFDAGADDVVA